MFLGLLRRMVFWELAKIFGLSLPGITFIIVMAAIVPEASQRGLGPAQILVSIPLIVPSMLPFIIPPTTLFATCVVYGRLAHDSEVIAIKAAGINILHIIWPAVFLGLAASVATLGMFYYWIPYTHHLLRVAVVNDMEEYLYSLLRKDHEIRSRQPANPTRPSAQNYDMVVESVQGRQLKTAFFMRRDGHGHYDIIAKAREAELHVDAENKEVIVHMRHCTIFDEEGKTRVYTEDRSWSVPLPDFDKSKQSPRDMTWQEVLQSREEIKQLEEKQRTDIALLVANEMVQKGNADLAQHKKNLEMILKQQEQMLRSLDTELQMRPALSFGCLFFVLVGSPVGIWFSRSDYLSAFITCFLPIVFVYYPLQLCCTNLAKDGKLDPALALWIANGTIGLLAVILFRRLLRN